MIEIHRSPIEEVPFRVKVIGVGGAGCHAADQVFREGVPAIELLAANTDSRALNGSLVSSRILLGQKLTRGLGAGGDPELGRKAVDESRVEVLENLEGTSLIILLAGLGGGTGSGAAARIASLAKSKGVMVVAIVTMPFSFEGVRRVEQAAAALSVLRAQADLVVCFENDQMSSLVDTSAGVEDAFAAVDALIAESVRSLTALSRRRSMIHSGIDDVAAALHGSSVSAVFGHGAAEGENRVLEALRRALSGPMLNPSQLAECTGLWVSVSGGRDLKFSELQHLMSEVNSRVASHVRLFLGASVDHSLGETFTVTLLGGILPAGHASEHPSTSSAEEWSRLEHSAGGSYETEALAQRNTGDEPDGGALSENTNTGEFDEPSEEAQSDYADDSKVSVLPARPPFEERVEMRRDIGAALLRKRQAERSEAEAAKEAELNLAAETAPEQKTVSEMPVRTASVAEHISPERAPVPGAQGGKPKASVQEQMQFETINRGRFEKTDPTVIDGQDLDVPTFMRRHVPLEGGDAHGER